MVAIFVPVLLLRAYSSLTARDVQNELHLKTLALYNLATLTPEQIKNEENYFTLMYQNIDNLKQEIY